jgi:hypothetical protein
MLAVAVQVPASVLVDPEANAGIASVRTAQIADAADFIRTGD